MRTGFRSYRIVAALALLLVVAGCATKPTPVELTPRAERLSLTPVDFSDLPGWEDDRVGEALPALLRSCAVTVHKPAAATGLGGTGADWAAPCAEAQTVSLGDSTAARGFFQRWFQPYAVKGAGGEEGLFTGYYEPELRGSLVREGGYQTPLYARPDDLISVDLGSFLADLKGRHIVGKVQDRKLVLYDDRAAIAAGSLDNRARVLLWVDDPADAFFLQVQGSGRVRLTDGSMVSVGYDGANGRSYVALGGALAARGEIDKPVTMHKIRGWLKAHPEQAEAALDLNPSYVFFKQTSGDGPVGAEGVALTPRRSLAVDPAFMPLGAPVWLDTVDGAGAPLRQMMVAQDTGGAIKGAVRGDIFWGFGADAAAQAGAMQGRGRYYLLLPKIVTPP